MGAVFTIKGAKEKRGKIIHRMREIGDKISAEGRAMDATEAAEFEKLKTALGEANKAIADAEAIAASINTGGGGDDMDEDEPEPADSERQKRRDKRPAMTAQQCAEYRNAAFNGWTRAQSGLPLDKRHAQACKVLGINPRAKEWCEPLPARGSRSWSLTAAAGGHTVPQGFINTLEVYLIAFSGPRDAGDVFRTEGGNPTPYPTVNDTANNGELLTEATETDEDESTPFGQSVFGAYKFSSKEIPVSHELMQDSAFDVGVIVAEIAGERIGRTQNPYLTTGTGSGQPQGFVTGSTLGRTATNVGSITYDDAVYLFHSVDPAYRSSPSACWMANDATIAALSLLKDSTGRPLLLVSPRDDADLVIRGKPVRVATAMADIGADAKPLTFGDMSKFKIRDAGDVRVYRLEERRREKDQTSFIAFLRSDSKLINTAAVKHLVHPSS